ncbi:hypothetical protein [Streptomyces sp. SAI-127]|uniref:hypothetical protein n=1 Tax=Streptomyces sp. SAI-127 TaxID=2940543 RepID=UPI0024744937|nr:hypothetical protein [Streptomyces sp. SAI-127]MDH6489677.1 hypothetical protein [Streptomyces sp. SAI-127]
MANKSFSYNTDPHVATVNGTELRFEPEIMGDEFMDAFGELRDAQKAAQGIDLEDLSTLDPAALRGASRGLRGFLARLMLPEDAERFMALNVATKDGTLLSTHQEWDEAQEAADQVDGARVKWAMPMPDRILVQLMEWVTELYGGGADQRPPTSRGGSAKASPRAGKAGAARSRSKG